MDKKQEIFQALQNAQKKLYQGLQLPENGINTDATIQRFKITFELTWKLLNVLVRESIQEVYGPKNTLREAVKLGFIENIEKWFEFLDARNLTTHTYEEETAEEVYKTAVQFNVEVEMLIEKAKSML